MSAAQHVSSADAKQWFRHFYQATIRGAAEGLDSALNTSGGGVAAAGADAIFSSGQHINVSMIGGAAIGAMVFSAAKAVAKFLKENPGPTGDEVRDPGDDPSRPEPPGS